MGLILMISGISIYGFKGESYILVSEDIRDIHIWAYRGVLHLGHTCERNPIIRLGRLKALAPYKELYQSLWSDLSPFSTIGTIQNQAEPEPVFLVLVLFPFRMAPLQRRFLEPSLVPAPDRGPGLQAPVRGPPVVPEGFLGVHCWFPNCGSGTPCGP